MLIAGIDEAGRGPALGPLSIACAVIEKEREEELISLGVTDSKLLTPKQREEFYTQLPEILHEFNFLQIQPKELDELMQRKSLNEIEAMKIGFLLNNLKEKPEIVFVDSPDPVSSEFAKRIQKYISFKVKIVSEHKADFKYPIVSAASIIAKVERDKEISELTKIHGRIGSGYPSDPETIKFIEEYLKKFGKLPEFARKKWQTNQRLVDEKFQQKLF
ncbi:MAG: ribonuclease HII [Candidatus Diapherotrites archaeon]|nr:ribonuclease HII [Candidatus Diapherotrites archaeon]